MEDMTSKLVGGTRVSVVGETVLIEFNDDKFARSFSDIVLEILAGCDLVVRIFSGFGSSQEDILSKGGEK